MKEIDRGIELANAYDDIVVAVNVGNEALDPEARQDADDDEDDFPDGIAQVPPEFPVHEKTPLDLPEDEHRYLSPSWRGSGTIRDSFDSAVIFAFNTALAKGFCRGRCRD